MARREDIRGQIASRLEKLGTLDKLAEEMPGLREGNGWDPSKIVETRMRVVPQPLDRLVRRATRPGILQRVADSFRQASAISRLAGLPYCSLFPFMVCEGAP